MKKLLILAACAALWSGCATYFDSTDPYVSGMRWFNRQEYKWARHYWEPLADEGDCDAEYRMGTLYFLGAGVPQNYDTAREWWLKAARQGQSFAQALLGTMSAHDVLAVTTIRSQVRFDCTQGCGCAKNLMEAYQWMRLSERCAVYDDTRKAAGTTANKYQQSLTPEQIAVADTFVKQWQPEHNASPPRQLY